MIDISKVRTETDGTENLIHFNNSGCSLPPNVVRNRQIEYLKEESLLGGYETEAKYQEEHLQVYHSVAKLIGADPTEIALVESASTAWVRAFYSIPFKPGDVILTSEVEYVTNFVNYIYIAMQKKVGIKIIPSDLDGRVDVGQLEALIDDKVKLVSITHIPTNGGLVNPVEKIGEVTSRHGVLFLLDSCQSVGQYPVNVNKIKCDFLCATGRKFLRGPRGTGFLFIKKEHLENLLPPWVESGSATWTEKNSIKIRPDARRYETWERSYAGQLALGVAVNYALDLGMENIWKRICELSDWMRGELRSRPGVEVLDRGEINGGILSFRCEKIDPEKLKAEMAKRGINISTSSRNYTLIDMDKRNLDIICRLGIHYYNTKVELKVFLKALDEYL